MGYTEIPFTSLLSYLGTPDKMQHGVGTLQNNLPFKNHNSLVSSLEANQCFQCKGIN